MDEVVTLDNLLSVIGGIIAGEISITNNDDKITEIIRKIYGTEI